MKPNHPKNSTPEAAQEGKPRRLGPLTPEEIEDLRADAKAALEIMSEAYRQRKLRESKPDQ